jgi:hypothetical protein
MSSFALVNSGMIIQISETAFDVALPLAWTSDISTVSPEPEVGWGAVETAGAWTFTAPAAPPTPPPPTQIAPLAFQGRFTSAEAASIFAAAQTNVALNQWLWQTAAAQYIDLADPMTKDGLDAMVAAGLLTAARETVILTP